MSIKKISGFEKYFISSDGEVYSDKYKDRRKLKLRKNSKGYLYVNLCKDGKYRSIEVHRLVAQEFLQDFSSSLQVNHIDGNKENNSMSNLEMVSQADNIKHAVDTGLLTPKHGKDHWASKLCDEDIIRIRKLYSEGTKVCDIYKMYKDKISRETISQIVNNRIWKHIK